MSRVGITSSSLAENSERIQYLSRAAMPHRILLLASLLTAAGVLLKDPDGGGGAARHRSVRPDAIADGHGVLQRLGWFRSARLFHFLGHGQ
jgi:hypothetical protein